MAFKFRVWDKSAFGVWTGESGTSVLKVVCREIGMQFLGEVV
jgi:hypothetical protein